MCIRDREYIDQALAIEPQNVLALRNQAYLLERLGKYDEALAILDRALAIEPQRSDLFMEKARIYRVGLADFANALVAYRNAVEANKTPVTLTPWARASTTPATISRRCVSYARRWR